MGGGNDLAKVGGVNRHNPVRAVRRLVTAQTARFDAGLVCEEYFVNSVGFGFGPEVVRVRNAMPGLSGFASYFVPVLRAFAGYRPQRFEVRARGFAETGDMMMMEVCNGTTAGGNYRVAPDALPGDGRLDVCLVRRVSLLRFLMAVPRVVRRAHRTLREVAPFQTPTAGTNALHPALLLSPVR